MAVTTNARAAARYAKAGWPVFPVNGKLPLTPHGVLDASTDPLQVASWWERWPEAGVAIATGGDTHLCAVDVDGDAGAASLVHLEAEHGAMPKTRTARTGGGGMHLLYVFPPDVQPTNTAGLLGEGIDTRGEGGYIVAPPSVHPNGTNYAWASHAKVAPAPDWLVDVFRERARPPERAAATPSPERDVTAYVRAALAGETGAVASAPEGQRNHTLNAAAYSLGQLVGGGHLRSHDAYADLMHAARQAGLGEVEASRTIRSGLDAGEQNPRHPPERDAAAGGPGYDTLQHQRAVDAAAPPVAAHPEDRSQPAALASAEADFQRGVSPSDAVAPPASPTATARTSDASEDPTSPPARWAIPWREWRTKPANDVDWLVRGLLPAGGLSVIGSTPKAGKTWLTIHLALACTTAKAFLGRFAIPTEIGVHYAALEGSDAALRHRVGALANGMGLDPDTDERIGDSLHVAYKPRGFNLSHPEAAKVYVEDVLRTGARLAIVDTIRAGSRIRESGEGVEDLQALQHHLRPLSDAGISVLLLHHVRKLRNDAGWAPPLERLSGSGAWGGVAEVGIVLERTANSDWRRVRCDVDGRDVPSLPHLTISYEGEGSGPEGLLGYTDALAVRVTDTQEDETTSTFDAASVAGWLATRERVEATTAELADYADVSKRTVPNHHAALKRQGVAWTEPRPGKARSYYLNSPAYAHLRKDD